MCIARTRVYAAGRKGPLAYYLTTTYLRTRNGVFLPVITDISHIPRYPRETRLGPSPHTRRPSRNTSAPGELIRDSLRRYAIQVMSHRRRRRRRPTVAKRGYNIYRQKFSNVVVHYVGRVARTPQSGWTNKLRGSTAKPDIERKHDVWYTITRFLFVRTAPVFRNFDFSLDVSFRPDITNNRSFFLAISNNRFWYVIDRLIRVVATYTIVWISIFKPYVIHIVINVRSPVMDNETPPETNLIRFFK